jgi:aspartate/methionine/tyrosine aminotransferase
MTNTLLPRTIINEAAAASPKQPIINMGQGFFGYNPPDFILNAAKECLDRVECNQYSPTKGRPRLKKAISEAYAPHWGRKLDPDTEITITTGANEGPFLPGLQAPLVMPLTSSRDVECLHGIYRARGRGHHF